QYVSQFPRWCAAVYAECPDADARDFLLENIVEEESGIKHVDLLIRFGEACGVSRKEVETARQLPTTRALTAWCYETSRQPFHVAAAGLLVGLESQVPGIYKRNLPPLKSKYGFNEHEVEFFAIHIEADEVHGERGYQIVERHSDTPERRAQALEQVRQATEMRWQYMSGLHRAYVLKEDA
ncbi:MAG: aldehyde dehydrogenase, partial [Candidatus Rokuibacteriota bacterium]